MDTYKLNFTILELELFSLLCLRAGEKFSQRELARELGVSPTAVGNAAKQLLTKNLIKKETTKTINFLTFNRDSSSAVDLKRVENLRQLYLLGLPDYLAEELPGAAITLFGSYSRGEDTKNSDIDLAVIGRKDKLLSLERFEKALYRPLNVNFYPSWKDIHKHLKNNILGGILLSGGVEL